MIPKIIHYCWFGKKEKPRKVLECIESWKRHNPDYMIKEWNESNFAYNNIPFTREAYRLGRYAFVSDVVRLYALIHEGGIYMDTDVLVFNSFTSLLNNISFMSLEGTFRLSTAVIGSEARVKWVESFYSFYMKQHFILKNGSLLNTPNTTLLSKHLTDNYDLKSNELLVLPKEILCGRNIVTGSECKNTETIAIHNFSASWKNKKSNRLKNLLVRILKLKK